MAWDEAALEQLRGATVVAGGEAIGSVEEVFAHAAEDRPALARVSTAGGSVLVPLHGGDGADSDSLEVDFGADQIKAAPAGGDDQLSAADFEAVYAHYGIADATMREQGRP